jgi:hypothetical protein
LERCYVALLAPEAVSGLDAAALAAALRDAFAVVHKQDFELRALISIVNPPDSASREALTAIKAALATRNMAAQWLLGGQVAPEFAGAGTMAQMPVAASEGDQRALALALSDIVVVGPGTSWVKDGAARLNKPAFPPGGDLVSLQISSRDVMSLDPAQRSPRQLLAHFAGRFEAFWLSLLTLEFKRIVSSNGPLSIGLHGRWSPNSAFPTEATRPYALDRSALAPEEGPARSSYGALDRAAIYGARAHRDMIWAICVLTALAAIFAGFGKASSQTDAGASGFVIAAQFFTLIPVLILLPWVWLLHLRNRWIAARVGAEDLRLAQILVPMMIAPPQMTLPDVAKADLAPAPPSGLLGRSTPDYRRMAAQEVVRAVRSQGLPVLDADVDDKRRAAWLIANVDEQIRYHRANQARLRGADRNALWLTYIITALSLLAPLAESIVGYAHQAETWFGISPDFIVALRAWLQDSPSHLVIVTALPAIGAAFHGAATRMSFANRAQLSVRVSEALAEVKRQLADSLDSGWPALRRLALAAAQAMEDENQSWHNSLVRARDMPPM